MKLFNIEFTNNELIGNALVQAPTAHKAMLTLRGQGKLNGNGAYQITVIQEIGCNDSVESSVIQENYGSPNIENKQKKIDIDISALKKEITNEVLNAVKPHINMRKLYVDKIGVQTKNPHVEGYTVFYQRTPYPSEYDPDYKLHFHLLKYHLDGSYEDLGIPNKYSIIESSEKRFTAYSGWQNRNDIIREYFPKQIGLFIYYPNRVRIRRKHDIDNGKVKLLRYPHWHFIGAVNRDISEKELKRKVLHYIEKNDVFDFYSIKEHSVDVGTVKNTIFKFCIGEFRKRKISKDSSIVSYRLKGVPKYVFTFGYSSKE